MTKPLVIVESPAKARTISGYLGDGFVVESSIGHIRDLPRNASEVPASHKSEPWARLGVDTENDFKPLYVVPQDKKAQVKKLKDLLKNASELFLATDEDREGESIAWHLLETLNPKIPVKRMVFHEITPDAIQNAIENPRDLDRHLVDAQEARRILDRLVGYEVSPVLWKMVRPKLSAGRVQSPAVRIIVDRERERMLFKLATYFDLEGTFPLSPARKRRGLSRESSSALMMSALLPERTSVSPASFPPRKRSLCSTRKRPKSSRPSCRPPTSRFVASSASRTRRSRLRLSARRPCSKKRAASFGSRLPGR